MVSCKQCATPNSLDSTFCKRCGVALPEDDVKVARGKLEVLLQEGMSAFNEGRIEEALAIGESCLTTDPTSLLALSLMADSHARKGEIAIALEFAERVVELNPDSELDKIKRNQLRNQLATSLRVAEPVDRRMALVAAFAAVLLVVCIGAIVAKLTTRNPDSNLAMNTPLGTSGLNVVPNGATETQNPGLGSGNVNTQNPATANPNPANNPEPSNGDPNYVAPVTTTGGGDGGNSMPLQKYTGNQLPLPGSVPDGTDVIVHPLEGPVGGGGGGVVLKANSTPTSRPTSQVDPNPKTDQTTTNPATQADEPDSGVYDIKVSSGSKVRNNVGGSEDIDRNAGSAEALSRTATQQYQLGNYGGAAGTYEKALRAGADAVLVNQRLGQAYEKLGRSNDAAAAYTRAIAAGEAAMNSGRGNKERIQGAVEACRQALRVIQGG